MLQQGLKLPTNKQLYKGIAIVLVLSILFGGTTTVGLGKLFGWL